ncbi:MAG: C-type lectin domain-containing protein, partial [Myxococcales bacterium]|nr:C-type lectin domain-containing protein [Myxococcales bacterium]
TVPSAPGYEQVSGTDVRYRPVLAPATLEAAAADCDDDVAGAHLVVVDDAAENGVVRRFADARVAGDRIWLGITDAAIEGVWRTVDGAAVDYVHWKDGEPNDGGDDGDGEDCAVMLGVHDPGPDRGRWNDVACDEPHPYVCEWHPPASP